MADDGRSGEWQPVPRVPDTFVINLGDLMRRWTNDRWSSTLHRVVMPPADAEGSCRRQVGDRTEPRGLNAAHSAFGAMCVVSLCSAVHSLEGMAGGFLLISSPPSAGKSFHRCSSSQIVVWFVTWQSMAFFHNINADHMVTCIDTCQSPEHPARYVAAHAALSKATALCAEARSPLCEIAMDRGALWRRGSVALWRRTAPKVPGHQSIRLSDDEAHCGHQRQQRVHF